MKIKTIMPQVRGLGDVVHMFAQPVARAIDSVAGTNLQDCDGCKRRREALNKRFPMKTTASAIVLLLSVLSSSALDWGYSTNLYSGLPYVTNVYCGTNGTDTGRDGYLTAWNKLNNNDRFLEAKLGGYITAQRVEATNFWLSVPRWGDALAAGLTLAAGAAAPEKADLPGAWTTAAQAYRFGHGDHASFVIQTMHTLASTNAGFPAFYYEPHAHICAANTNAGTNATFVLEWEAAVPLTGYSSHEIRTNTYGFTGTNTHGIVSFGLVTNNALRNASSVIFRGSIKRIASAANDVGSGATLSQKVFVDFLDFHVPFRSMGSSGIYGAE